MDQKNTHNFLLCHSISVRSSRYQFIEISLSTQPSGLVVDSFGANLSVGYLP